MSTRRIIVLGSTGSIGTQTLDVIEHLERLSREAPGTPTFEVVGLAAGSDARALGEQSARYPNAATALASGSAGGATFVGTDAAERLVREVDADVVVASIVGIAGLPSTLAAVELGRTVALANKETLVAAGSLVVQTCRRSGATLRPVDSEHSALWQALAGAPRDETPRLEAPFDTPASVSRLVLTASGGPFRSKSLDEIRSATPAAALAHPTWSMGPKVTVDCASLMNKGLELIEAHWLFGCEPDRLGVLVHPQSIVHSMVEMRDGSVLAQLGVTDMRGPIHFALGFPERTDACVPRLDLARVGTLSFEDPDLERFPALGLAFDAMRAGGTAGATLNAANEAAVGAFLRADGGLSLGRVIDTVAEVCSDSPVNPITDLDDVYAADADARRRVVERLGVIAEAG